MELRLGKMTGHEIADWLEVSYTYYQSSIDKQLEKLSDYCDFKKIYGGVDIKEIYSNEKYQKPNERYARSGIYCIKIKDLIVYIGESKNLWRRFQKHRIGIQKLLDMPMYQVLNYYKDEVSFEILEYCNENELSERENYYINKFFSEIMLNTRINNQNYRYNVKEVIEKIKKLDSSAIKYGEINKRDVKIRKKLKYYTKAMQIRTICKEYLEKQIDDEKFVKIMQKCISEMN